MNNINNLENKKIFVAYCPVQDSIVEVTQTMISCESPEGIIECSYVAGGNDCPIFETCPVVKMVYLMCLKINEGRIL